MIVNFMLLICIDLFLDSGVRYDLDIWLYNVIVQTFAKNETETEFSGT